MWCTYILHKKVSYPQHSFKPSPSIISNMTPLKIMITIIPMLLAVSNTQNVDPYSNFFAIQSKLANPQAHQTFQIGYWRLTNKKGHQIRNFTPSEKKTALAIILLNLLAGLLYRGLILKNIIKTGSLTPCNIMTGILRDEVDWSLIAHALYWITYHFSIIFA